MTKPKPKWYCGTPEEYAIGDGLVACGGLPCNGHPVTKDVQLAAEVWAWADGYALGIFSGSQADDPLFAKVRQDYLNVAGDFIKRRGPK